MKGNVCVIRSMVGDLVKATAHRSQQGVGAQMLSDPGPSWLDPLWIIDFGCAVILHGTIRYQKNQEMSRSKIDLQKKSWQPRGARE